ncbi:MAG: hypothetical protein ABSG61_14305 [Gemmatimonadales bacterium]|jgi:hypothetical protein
MRALVALLFLSPLVACATVAGAGRAAAPATPAAALAADTFITRLPEPNQRVRVIIPANDTVSQWTMVGAFRQLTGDTLVLRVPQARAGALDTVRLGGGRQLQVVVGHHDDGRAGFFLGFLIGMGVGGVLGSNCTASSGFVPNLCPLAVAGGLVGGGFLGGAAGWAIGRAIVTEDWRTARVGAVRSSARPTWLGLRVSF